MVFWLALILTFSPGEKGQPSSVFRFANDRPANPVARISANCRSKRLVVFQGKVSKYQKKIMETLLNLLRKVVFGGSHTLEGSP
jgi:hypothetical protein